MTQDHRTSATTTATALGLVAIVFWSTVVAVSRGLTEEVGALTAAAAIYLLAGVVGCARVLVFRRARASLGRLPRTYLVGCGLLFALYAACLYLAVGTASGRQQVVEVGIINYLWPGLTLVLSVPLLKKRARPWLVPGIAVALAGVVLAMVQGGGYSWERLRESLAQNAWPYLFALGGAVSWALYSNLSRRWGAGAAAGGVPLFLLATGLLLLALRLARHEETHWTPAAIAGLAYLGVGPTLLAYSFWDVAMRRGRIILVVSASYLTPLLSMIVSSVYLGVALGPGLWLACGLVILGAVVCNASVSDAEV